MVHPKYRVVAAGAPVADRLTPVYPTTAGLSQASLQRMVRDALAADELDDTLPPALLAKLKLAGLRQQRTLPASSAAGGAARAARATHASGLAAHQVRRTAGAAIVDAHSLRPAQTRQRAATEGARGADARAARHAAVRADRSAAQGGGRDQRRSGAALPDAAPAAGRRRQRQDHRGGARRAAGDRKRLSGRDHGADRNSRRAALRQIFGLA